MLDVRAARCTQGTVHTSGTAASTCWKKRSIFSVAACSAEVFGELSVAINAAHMSMRIMGEAVSTRVGCRRTRTIAKHAAGRVGGLVDLAWGWFWSGPRRQAAFWPHFYSRYIS